MSDPLAASPLPDGRRVAIIQSNYIPWKGYFDIIHDVDLFIFHDDLQYTKDDWRNRNRIKTQAGSRWLTIPVGRDENRLICDVPLPPPAWAREHWRLLAEAYARAPYFETYRSFFEKIFLGDLPPSLSTFNQNLIRRISSELLGLRTRFDDSRNYALTTRKQERVLELLAKAGATTYISGPSARSYLSPESFVTAQIALVWKDYAGYPEYSQLHGPYEPAVSILDLLFNTGPLAAHHIWGWRQTTTLMP